MMPSISINYLCSFTWTFVTDDSNWEESSQYEGTEYLKLTRLQFKFLSVIQGLTSRKVSLQASKLREGEPE
jgi:hypothetical protein